MDRQTSDNGVGHAYACVCVLINYCRLNIRVTTCIENLEMSGILTAVSQDFTKSQGSVREKMLSGKSGQNCLLLDAYLLFLNLSRLC